MHDHRVLAVIPARIASERLPRKPLHRIAGRPLIEWVWRRVSGFRGIDTLVIATDSEEIAEASLAFGAEVELTSSSHPSGTDRVAEVASRPRYHDYDIVVNIQGDEPFIGEAEVLGAIEMVADGWDVGTAAGPLGSLEAWHDPAVVKVVRRGDGGALYFSRAPIPYLRDREPTPQELASPPFLRHVGVYAFTRAALAEWVTLPPGELEILERLEQLRALAAGLSIGVAPVDHVEGGVDTIEDARRVERRLLAGV